VGDHNSHCSTCDPSECYTCNTNRVANGTDCICLPGTYDDGISCQPCDPSCNECSGGGPNQCTSCTPPRGLISDGSCPICNSPSYLENGYCITCHISCLTCTWSRARLLPHMSPGKVPLSNPGPLSIKLRQQPVLQLVDGQLPRLLDLVPHLHRLPGLLHLMPARIHPQSHLVESSASCHLYGRSSLLRHGSTFRRRKWGVSVLPLGCNSFSLLQDLWVCHRILRLLRMV
jgi:hypothetical protein